MLQEEPLATPRAQKTLPRQHVSGEGIWHQYQAGIMWHILQHILPL